MLNDFVLTIFLAVTFLVTFIDMMTAVEIKRTKTTSPAFGGIWKMHVSVLISGGLL